MLAMRLLQSSKATKKPIARNKTALQRRAVLFRWRKRWDSNPRALADYLISSQARYDHFDTLPSHNCNRYIIHYLRTIVKGFARKIFTTPKYRLTTGGKCIIMEKAKAVFANERKNVMDLEKLKGLRRNLLLTAMLELIAGLFMIIMKDRSQEILIVMLGVIAASYGIVNFFAWLIKKDKSGAGSEVVILVLGVAAGAMLVIFRNDLSRFFILIEGILAGIFGVVKLPNMFAIKKAGFEKWWVMLLLILATVGIGIIIGLNAFDEKFFLLATILLGVSLILGSATDIFAMAGTGSVQKQLLAVEGEIDAEAHEKGEIVEKK